MDLKNIGAYLLEIRLYYHLSEEELASRIDAAVANIKSWEAGDSLPSIEMLMALSKLYGISINEIIEADTESIKHKSGIILVDEHPGGKKVMVIGCGRWGSFLAWYADKIGHRVSLYGRNSSENMKKFIETRKNDYLQLPETIDLTTDLNKAHEADILIISINSQNLQSLADQLSELKIVGKIIILCMKGIEISTGRRLSQIIDGTLDKSNKVAVWIGPGHVQEFYKGIPNCMVIDSNDKAVIELLVDAFSSDLIRFYYGTDLIGNEIGAAAKNVIGIAAGMLDGVNLTSLKGALMSRGTREIARLIKAMGGNELSAYGLCHLGDYEATVFSEFSHNRKFGECFVKDKTYDRLAEGYYTVKALVSLGKNYGVDLPICNAVYNILFAGTDEKETLYKLFSRSQKSEV